MELGSTTINFIATEKRRSDTLMKNTHKSELLNLMKDTLGCILHGDFTLSSGIQSNLYIDSKKVTLTAKGLNLITDCFHEILPCEAIAGGMATGAIPLVTAWCLRYGQEFFFVRKNAKDHGTKVVIEGNVTARSDVIILEDVSTTGNAIIQVVEALKPTGCNILGALAIVDRGASESLKQKGIPFYSIFKEDDFENKR